MQKCNEVPIGKSSDGQEQNKSNIKFGRGGDLEQDWKTITNWKKWGIWTLNIKIIGENQQDIKDNNKIRQAGLARSDIEWEGRAQGKFVNVL